MHALHVLPSRDKLLTRRKVSREHLASSLTVVTDALFKKGLARYIFCRCLRSIFCPRKIIPLSWRYKFSKIKDITTHHIPHTKHTSLWRFTFHTYIRSLPDCFSQDTSLHRDHFQSCPTYSTKPSHNKLLPQRKPSNLHELPILNRFKHIPSKIHVYQIFQELLL